MLEPIEFSVFCYADKKLSIEEKCLNPSSGTPESVVSFVRGISNTCRWQSEDGKVSRNKAISNSDFMILERIINRHMENVWLEIIDKLGESNYCGLFAAAIYESVVDWRKIRMDEETYQKAMGVLLVNIRKKAEELKDLLSEFEVHARVDIRRGITGWVTSSKERRSILESLNALTDKDSLQKIESHVADVDIVLSSQKGGIKSDVTRALLAALKRNHFPYLGESQPAGKAKMWTLMAEAMIVVTDLEFKAQDFYKMDKSLSDYFEGAGK